jgi:hypothetical protein
MQSLDWWKIGPYRQCGRVPPFKFYFSAGDLEHEKIHVKQLKDGGTTVFPVASISKEVNEGKYGIKSLATYTEMVPYSSYKCPEKVLSAKFGSGKNYATLQEKLKWQFIKALSDANNLHNRGGYQMKNGCLKPSSEFEADELVRWKYDEIKKNIKNWAKQQSWWCSFIVAGYLDCEGQTCTP